MFSRVSEVGTIPFTILHMSVASAWLSPTDTKGRREILRNAYVVFCVQHTDICRCKRKFFFENSLEILFHYDNRGIALSLSHLNVFITAELVLCQVSST
jgi:hypothetical protein